jgi:hypothetical protein
MTASESIVAAEYSGVPGDETEPRRRSSIELPDGQERTEEITRASGSRSIGTIE